MELGDKVRDKVTGYQGIVTGLAQYLHGNDRALVEAPMNAEGLPKEQWFEVGRLSPAQ